MVSPSPKTQRIIVLTGNIASGKSTAAKLLKKMGEIVISADEGVHQLLKKTEHQLEIQKRLDKTKNSSKENLVKLIRKNLFSNKEFQRWYLPWVHTLVANQMSQDILKFRKSKKRTLFLEIPLYFEQATSWLSPDQVWLVWTPLKNRIQRWKARSKASFAEMQKIELWQMADEKKFQHVDIIFVNAMSPIELNQQLAIGLEKLKAA